MPLITGKPLDIFGSVTASANLVYREILERQICATQNILKIPLTMIDNARICQLLDKGLLVEFWRSNMFLQIWIPHYRRAQKCDHVTQCWPNQLLELFQRQIAISILDDDNEELQLRGGSSMDHLRLYPRALSLPVYIWFLQCLEPGTGTKHLQHLDSAETEMCHAIVLRLANKMSAQNLSKKNMLYIYIYHAIIIILLISSKKNP